MLLHWDGKALEVANESALNDYLDGWSSGIDDVWLVGSSQDGGGVTYRWDGSSWTDVPNPAT